jgi:SAM-dependent methyltransferase
VAEFHFVEDYERLVKRLMAEHPIDEAMSRAVGGGYDAQGRVQATILCHFGLSNGMSLIDLGCGSGRLSAAIGRVVNIDYLGIDIVQDLLDYAKTKSPPNYRFVLHRALSIPAPDNSADHVSAFSVFTHLLQAETFLYMKDISRVLRSGGSLTFSFLELESSYHWEAFMSTVEGRRTNSAAHLNMFIERNQIRIWCERLGFTEPRFFDASQSPWGGKGLGQSIAVTTKR